MIPQSETTYIRHKHELWENEILITWREKGAKLRYSPKGNKRTSSSSRLEAGANPRRATKGNG